MSDFKLKQSKHQRKLKRGYVGFLTKICNNIIKKAEDDQFINQKIEQSENNLKFNKIRIF